MSLLPESKWTGQTHSQVFAKAIISLATNIGFSLYLRNHDDFRSQRSPRVVLDLVLSRPALLTHILKTNSQFLFLYRRREKLFLQKPRWKWKANRFPRSDWTQGVTVYDSIRCCHYGAGVILVRSARSDAVLWSVPSWAPIDKFGNDM